MMRVTVHYVVDENVILTSSLTALPPIGAHVFLKEDGRGEQEGYEGTKDYGGFVVKGIVQLVRESFRNVSMSRGGKKIMVSDTNETWEVHLEKIED